MMRWTRWILVLILMPRGMFFSPLDSVKGGNNYKLVCNLSPDENIQDLMNRLY